MVHFHIHTDGYDAETDGAGRRRVVRPVIINMVWVGLGVLLWVSALFLVIETIRGIEKL